MKKSDFRKGPAKRAEAPEDAAKQLDRAVSRIIRSLRRGQSAHLPGVGTLNPGKPWTFQPERTGNGK